MKLIGVDVGGTFTDIVCTDTETCHTIIHKAPTTPDDPSHGVILGVSELCERFGLVRGDIDHVLHGTTIATNAVLEYNGAVTGMVTSEGYRDILHIGRHQRPQHYSIMQDIPWQDRPLVRRRFRKTVPERLMPPHGDVLIPWTSLPCARWPVNSRPRASRPLRCVFCFPTSTRRTKSAPAPSSWKNIRTVLSRLLPPSRHSFGNSNALPPLP